MNFSLPNVIMFFAVVVIVLWYYIKHIMEQHGTKLDERRKSQLQILRFLFYGIIFFVIALVVTIVILGKLNS